MWLSIYVAVSILVGLYAKGKGLSFFQSFILSLLLSPLIGILATAFSKSREVKAPKTLGDRIMRRLLG